MVRYEAVYWLTTQLLPSVLVYTGVAEQPDTAQPRTDQKQFTDRPAGCSPVAATYYWCRYQHSTGRVALEPSQVIFVSDNCTCLFLFIIRTVYTAPHTHTLPLRHTN